jgi:hypothetical protein
MYARYGAELATVDDGAQQRAIATGIAHMFGMYSVDDKGLYEEYQINVWLGYRKPASSQKWVNTRGLASDKWPFSNWYEGEPSARSSPGAERCAIQNVDTLKGDKEYSLWNWVSDTCEFGSAEYMAHGVVCRLPPIGGPPTECAPNGCLLLAAAWQHHF